MKAFPYLILLFFCWFSNACGISDLEELTQDFVLETKQINIPGFPIGFNPSIIRWKGSLLMAFRNIPDRRFSFNSQLYLIRLDDDFEPLGLPQHLDTRSPHSMVPSRAEDPRLIEVNQRLYLVYSDCKEDKISRGGFRVYVAEIHEEEGQFSLVHNEGIFYFEGASQLVREKNWVPFDYKGHLLLAYSLDPHRIFLPFPGTNTCSTFSVSHPIIQWDWGVLRGGTAALPLDEENYLSFFHSSIPLSTIHSNGQKLDHYVMGAYTFSREPPFEITAISPEPIVGKNFYNGPAYKPYWKPVQVVFPCGFTMDDRYIWIAYGRQDHEIWIAKLNRLALLESLIPVYQK